MQAKTPATTRTHFSRLQVRGPEAGGVAAGRAGVDVCVATDSVLWEMGADVGGGEVLVGLPQLRQ